LEITDDAAAKDVFIRIMERMDDRYRGLGAPSAPLKNPLDQWIDQHRPKSSRRGAAIFAWSPSGSVGQTIHLALAVTFLKPTGRNRALRRMVIEMLGINRAVYLRPTASHIRSFARVFFNKFVDLGSVGMGAGAVAPRGASVVVGAFRPKSMTWKPASRLQDCVRTEPASRLLKERDCDHSFYWQFKVTKL
jgi:hypothetical protein